MAVTQYNLISQNYNKIFKHNWLSPAQFEHLQDSVYLMFVTGQSYGTGHMSCL